jgi:outer membrane protein assembly factor BamE (lipoprotein component of BamABCDE complex)
MPTTIIDQRVVAIYFDKDRRVQRVADYGMKDGRVFDFVSRTTPTAGSDASLIKQLFSTIQNSKFTLPF